MCKIPYKSQSLGKLGYEWTWITPEGVDLIRMIVPLKYKNSFTYQTWTSEEHFFESKLIEVLLIRHQDDDKGLASRVPGFPWRFTLVNKASGLVLVSQGINLETLYIEEIINASLKELENAHHLKIGF